MRYRSVGKLYSLGFLEEVFLETGLPAPGLIGNPRLREHRGAGPLAVHRSKRQQVAGRHRGIVQRRRAPLPAKPCAAAPARRGRRRLAISGIRGHLAIRFDGEFTGRLGARRPVVESPVHDPADQRILEREMGRRATRRVTALPHHRVARALYLHQHLVRQAIYFRHRRQSIMDGLRVRRRRGPRREGQGPVHETLHDKRGFAQLPRDGAVPAVAGGGDHGVPHARPTVSCSMVWSQTCC